MRAGLSQFPLDIGARSCDDFLHRRRSLEADSITGNQRDDMLCHRKTSRISAPKKCLM